MPANTDVLKAPAKLTLSLRIVGVRSDGFHLIEAEMVSLDLCDTLILQHGDGVEFEGVGQMPDAESNLVVGALHLLGRRASVRVRKAIPAGAGLGGGSSDAAAILRWGRFEDLLSAASLGADVPFCLIGGRALVSGVGEKVEPLDFQPRTFTLAIPPFGCHTGSVYEAWDDLGGPAGQWGNDLEPAALAFEPRLAEVRDRLEAATGKRPRLAGSGSTWFVEGEYPQKDFLVVRTTPSQHP